MRREKKKRKEKKERDVESVSCSFLFFHFHPLTKKRVTGTDEEGGNVEEILVRHSLVKADADGLVVDAPQVDALADTLKKKKEDTA